MWEFLRFAETAKAHFRGWATQAHWVAKDYRGAVSTGAKTEMPPQFRCGGWSRALALPRSE